MTELKYIKIMDWRQFEGVNIDVSKPITVLTGQNGCGKTTLLNVVNRHFGWNLNFVSTPYIGKRRAKKMWSDIFRPSGKKSNLSKSKDTKESANIESTYDDDFDAELEEFEEGRKEIGTVVYDNDTKCSITTNTIVSAQYKPEYHNIQPVAGMHIPSHRPVASYTNVANIPTDPRTATQEYQQYQQLIIQFAGGGRVENPGKIQKQSLISFAVFGEGNASVTPNADIKKTFDEFQEVLRKLMPESIGFQKIEIRMPEVVLVTSSGDFSLDAMSGGVNAIFSIAWQIHMFAQDKAHFTVTIDEPENHLHPSMQRTLLPGLAKAFPKAKFIVSTHSPFMVSSFPEANIYALVRNANNRIVSELLDVSDVSGTPNEVLREILDVDSNLPVWVEDRIAKIIQESSALEPAEKARLIMQQLEQLGIADSLEEYGRSGSDETDS